LTKSLPAPESPVLTYSVDDRLAQTTIEISGYQDGSLDLTCKRTGDEPENMQISLTPKGVTTLKRALALWETAMELEVAPKGKRK
jgi:hypothetical protein